MRTSHVEILLLPVYDHPKGLPYFRGVHVGGDAFLHTHQVIQPVLLHLLWNLVFIMLIGVGTLLVAIGESAHALETDIFHEADQLLEILFRLAGMTHHQGGA